MYVKDGSQPLNWKDVQCFLTKFG